MTAGVIAVVATGGTIANTSAGRIGIEAVLETIGQETLQRAVGGRSIECSEVFREGADAFTPDHWLALGRRVEAAVRDPRIDGVVVTHGTYSVEETAYFLHLSVRTSKPIVLTVSQRKHQELGNDGDRNLVDALRVAADARSEPLGAVLVASEEIHSAREVRKVSQRPGGFSSAPWGPLGNIDIDRVTLYRRPVRLPAADSGFGVPADLPRVDIVPVYAGADAVAIEAYLGAGARGLVVGGFAYRGLAHPRQRDALRAASASGIPVVLTSRGGGGRVPVQEDSAFVYGDTLDALKARVLLALALAHDTPTGELQAVFDSH